MAEGKDRRLWAHTFGLVAGQCRAWGGEGPSVLDFYPWRDEVGSRKPTTKIKLPVTVLKDMVANGALARTITPQG